MALLTCYRKYCSSRSILLCYISSLAAADLLFAILSTVDVSYFFLEDWPGGNSLCKIQGTLIEICCTAIDLSCNQSWKISLGQINQSSEQSERCTMNYRDQNSVDSGHSCLRSVILRVRDQRRKWQVNSARIRSGETTEDKRTTCFKLCWFLSAL